MWTLFLPWTCYMQDSPTFRVGGCGGGGVFFSPHSQSQSDSRRSDGQLLLLGTTLSHSPSSHQGRLGFPSAGVEAAGGTTRPSILRCGRDRGCVLIIYTDVYKHWQAFNGFHICISINVNYCICTKGPLSQTGCHRCFHLHSIKQNMIFLWHRQTSPFHSPG